MTAPSGKSFRRTGGTRQYVQGLKEIEARLLALSRKAGKEVLEGGLIAIAEPLVDEMKVLVPVDDGDLRDSIAWGRKLTNSQTKKFRSAAIWKRKVQLGLNKTNRARRRLRKHETQNLLDTAVIHVGVSQTGAAIGTPKSEAGADPNQYAHLIEFGRPDASAQAFARPAWDAQKGSAMQRFTTFMRMKLGL